MRIAVSTSGACAPRVHSAHVDDMRRGLACYGHTVARLYGDCAVRPCSAAATHPRYDPAACQLPGDMGSGWAMRFLDAAAFRGERRLRDQLAIEVWRCE